MPQHPTTSRVLEQLKVRVYLAKLSQRQIEERLGFSRGYLSQVLGGFVDIKLWQVLAILYVIGIEPGDFFAELFPRHRSPITDTLEDYERHAVQDENKLNVELARLYGFGIESMADFRDRLERCEEALDELEEQGLLDESDDLDLDGREPDD